ESNAYAVGVQLGDLALQCLQEQAHQSGDFLRRTLPVLAGEGEQCQRLHAAPGALLHDQAGGGEAFFVPGGPWQAARSRPATIAVHDDRHMLRNPGRHGRGGRYWRGQTCMTSFSLAASSWSTSATCLSVSFCTSASARRSSSWETSFSLRSSLMSFMTSRRTLRTATRAFSASWRRTLVMSRRRSSVSGGIGMRMMVPAVIGFRPRSDLWMAFSMACTTVFSHGATTSVRPSSTEMLATCCRGTSEP